MSFYSEQFPSGDFVFPENPPIDLLSEHELDRACQLASALGDDAAALLFFFGENQLLPKSNVGIAHPEDFIPFLASLDTAEESFAQTAVSTAVPEGLAFIGCVWLRGAVSLGGIALFGKKETKLKEGQKQALELVGKNLVDCLWQKAEFKKIRSFEKIFNFSNDLVCIIDFQGRFERINPSFTSILGWTWEQIGGQTFDSYIFSEDLALTNEVFGQLLQGETAQKFMHRFLTHSGGFRVIQWTATPDVDSNRIYAIGRDITEEKKLENKLKDSKARMREFFENSQGLMCTHDINGRFLTVNSSGAAMAGYSRSEVLEKSLFDLVPDEYKGGIDYYLEQIKAHGKAEGQMYIRHRDGSVRTWLYNNVLQRPMDGEEPYVIGNAIDITSRAQLEKDLKVTKTLLEETGRVARVGGWELDLTTNKLLWTPATKLIHEVPEDFVPNLEQGIEFYKEGESREKISQAVKLAIEEGTPWNLDLQIITAQANTIWVRAIGNPIQENGKTVRLVGTFQDIDLAKKTELEAARAKKLLVDVFDASSEVSVIATDTEGIITVFNKGAEKMLGYTAEEMIGKQSPAIIHLPEEMDRHSEEVSEEFGYPVTGFEVFVARAEKTGSEKKDWTYLTKDGKKKLVELVVTPIKDLDQVTIGYLGIAIDITDKREAQIELINEKSRLTAFVKHTPAAVAMLDRKMTYIAVSNKWLQEFNQEGQKVVGESHYKLFSKMMNEEATKRHQRVLSGAVESKQEERIMFPGAEEAQYISWEMRPWYLHGGEIGGIMMFTQNVTGMVKRREELQLAKNMAEEASRAKSEFLANMSHEIRTPLNGVIGFTDLVLKTKLTDTQNQYLTIVNQSANALLGIINDILDFSKIEAGKLELDVEKTDLYELASQATDLITYQIQKKGLELLLNVDSDLPRFIYSDSVRLKQVLVNLLGNASKFTEKGEIELKIHMLDSEEDRTSIRFEVRDTGIGIHPEKQAKIFEAFSQEDSSTTKKYGGTGLGLTISNKLLGLMDSKLRIRSKLGKGSTFYFDVTFSSEKGEPIEWEGLENIHHVLVVDDNENNRTIVNQMLRLKNIKTTEATNGFEALQHLANGKRYDVVLMDYHMPFMDGVETIRKIRETFSGHLEDMPILLLHSSSDDQRIIQACKEFGIKYRLIKPLKIQELYHALAHLAEKHEPVEPVTEDPMLNTKVFKILIAEDNPINMLLAETILVNCLPNVALTKVENGQLAVDYCKREVPDLVFMDVQMPVMNGYEATQNIRRIPDCAAVPIVALTAGNVKGEKEKCLAAGMDDFVVKPVVEGTLRIVLDKWLGQPAGTEGSEGKSQEMPMHFDSEKLKAYADGNLDFLQKILSIVKDELNSSSRNLKLTLKTKNLKGVKETGHKLYGTSVSSGFGVLATLTRELELSERWEEPAMQDLIHKTLGEIETVLGLMDGD
ncbi:PAS domain S-box protein [Algoriphagus sp. H41]|uniref:histidine kinase n=1 Tax=Algoriphagus oliviformis TaxID=2811231 RepID=A0ABS3C7H6_9BACT|nr:PAS domain S-box protein [Algoriphagus oliviformis]MBN7813068.1 PAS domain S-box protein [Algoriphagus oliviformis]